MSVACQDAAASAKAAAGGAGAESGGFVATSDGWRYAGDLTLDNATAVFEASRALALPAGGRIDIGGLRHADSAALAVLIALKRRGSAEGVHLTFAGTPQPLHSLAVVYGVEALLA